VARRAWNRLFSLDCVTDCSNSSSCWERLASSDSKTSTCKNTTRNLCSLSLSPAMFSSTGRETGLDWYECAGYDTDQTTSRSVGLQQVPPLSGSTRVREMEKERLCFLLIGSCLPPPTTLKPHNTRRGQRATGPACCAFLAFQSCF